jgi:hypothetical protein
MMEYILTPDVFDVACLRHETCDGDLKIVLPGIPAPLPASVYDTVISILAGYNCEQGVTREWIAWYEILTMAYPHIARNRDARNRVVRRDKDGNEKITVKRGELDIVYTGYSPVGVYCLNHYFRTQHPNLSFWWKAGLLQRRVPRFRLKYTSHIIFPPAEYTIWGRLNQVYNKSSRLHTDVIIVDASEDTIQQIVSAMMHTRQHASILAKIPLKLLYTSPRIPSLIFNARQHFTNTILTVSAADASAGLALVDFIPKKAYYISDIEDWARGDSPSLYSSDRPPAHWDKFQTDYTGMLQSIAGRLSAGKPDAKKFAEEWLQVYKISPLDTRLYITVTGDISEEMPERDTDITRL